MGKFRLDSNLFLAWAIFRLGSGGFNVCLLDYVFPWLPSPIGFKYEHKVEHCLAFGHHQSFREFQLFWSLEKLGWKQKTQNFNVTEKWSGMYSKLTKLGENILDTVDRGYFGRFLDLAGWHNNWHDKTLQIWFEKVLLSLQ